MRTARPSPSMTSWALVLAGALLGVATAPMHGFRAGIIRLVAISLWGAGIWLQLSASGADEGPDYSDLGRAPSPAGASDQEAGTKEAVLA